MNVMMGVDPNQVDDTAKFALGTLGSPDGRALYMYLEADGTIAESDVAIIHPDGGSARITTTLAAAAAGFGKKCAVAPGSNRSQAIVAGKFYWGCIYATALMQVAANVLINCAAYTRLRTTATAGKLDDVATATTPFIDGLVTTVTEGGSGTAAIVVEINHPVVGLDLVA